jgi:hypothetical protein
MRTSLNEIKLIDEHLFNTGSTEDRLLFDAMLILNPSLPEQVMWQKNAHAIVQQYSRRKLKAEIEMVHQKLFDNSRLTSFRQKIFSIFG